MKIEDAKSLTNSRHEKAFFSAMDDDFNTAEACSVLFEMVTEINKLKSTNFDLANQLGKLLVKLGGTLGILNLQPEEFLREDKSINLDEVAINSLVAERDQARKEKNWSRADEIRDQLLSMKVVVEDANGASSWRIDR